MEISTENYELLFPMDVDKNKIVLAVMDRQRLIRKVTIPYDPVNLLHYARKAFPGSKRYFCL